MALSTVPFALQNAAHSADLFREAVSSLLPNTGGIVQTGDLTVTQTGAPSMAVQVGVGRAWVKGTEAGDLAGTTYSKQGLYFALNDAAVTKTITTANATNPRIDVFYIYVKDQQYSGVSNLVDFGVAAGTPAPSPAVPAIPANAMALANVAVAANATSIVNANITTAPNLALALPSPLPDGRVVRIGTVGSFAANVWTVMNTASVWGVETPAAGLAAFNGVWTITTAGEYDVEAGVMLDAAVTATLIIKKNSVTSDATGMMAGATAATGNSFSAAVVRRRIRCNAGDTLAIALIPNATAQWSNDKLNPSFFGLRYVQPLR